MAQFRSISAPLPNIPDDLSIPQFILDTHPFHLRPTRPTQTPWLIHDDTQHAVHHAEVTQRTRALANATSIKWNITANDVVCIFSPNNIDYPVSIWAVHQLGAVVTPANPGYTAEELAHQLSVTKAALLILHPAFLKTAKSAMYHAGMPQDRVLFIETPPSSQTPSGAFSTVDELVQFGLRNPPNFKERQFKAGEAKTALAFLSFSSGTTGKPKAVAISHYSVIANVIQMAAHYRIYDSSTKDKCILPGDIAIAVLPFFLVLLCKHPLAKDYDFSHVKYCVSGAAPLSGELMHELLKVLPNACIGQGYGLTETCTTVAIIPPGQKLGTIGSAGQLIPGIIAKVVKPDGSLAKEGEQGELVVTGPSMAMGYMNDETATKETFVNGWVHTGDEVIIRNGDLFIVDRLKEIMKVRGFQVAPAELEGHLLMHPDVADACVVPVLDAYSGEVPLGYIVLSDQASRRIASNGQAAEELKGIIVKHVADAKIHYKHLKGGVEFIDVIPKNPSGKILRRVLRDQARKMKEGKAESVRARL